MININHMIKYIDFTFCFRCFFWREKFIMDSVRWTPCTGYVQRITFRQLSPEPMMLTATLAKVNKSSSRYTLQASNFTYFENQFQESIEEVQEECVC